MSVGACSADLYQQLLDADYAVDLVTQACELGCSSYETCTLKIDSLSQGAQLEGVYTGLNTMFLLMSAYIVFTM